MLAPTTTVVVLLLLLMASSHGFSHSSLTTTKTTTSGTRFDAPLAPMRTGPAQKQNRGRKRNRSRGNTNALRCLGTDDTRTRLGGTNNDDTDNIELEFEFDDKLLTVASKKLPWETSEEKNQKPILNLSLRDASPEETRTEDNNDNNEDDSSEWNQGQRWKTTLGYLGDLGVVVVPDEISARSSIEESESSSSLSSESAVLLKHCPQLFRLEPTAIRETARYIVSEFGADYLRNAVLRDDAVLLSFRKDQVAYGLEFMSTMMMTDARPVCGASSAFFLQAIEGGIQERTVGAALGAASAATSKASRSIASDTMESVRKLRDVTRHKK